MNIFWLDEDMQKCAEYHCDKHVVKMLLETVQILNTALFKGYNKKYAEAADNRADPEDIKHLAEKAGKLPYKHTHSNHPCVKWAAYSTGNFKKLALLGTKLANEYTHRYEKIHSSAIALKIILQITNLNKELPFDDHMESRPPLCMPNTDFSASVEHNYREYYKEKLDNWSQMAYTNRDIPEWLEK